MESVEEFEGIVVQCDERLNLIFSNKTYNSLKTSEKSELMKTCSEVLSNNRPQRFQRHFSEEFYFFMAVPIITQKGGISGVALTGFSISFKIFKNVVLDNISDGVFYISVTDNEFFFRGANSMFLEFTGLKEADLIDKNVKDVIPPSHQEDYLSKYRLVLKEKKILRWEVSSEFNGIMRYGDLVLIPICNESLCTALIGIVHDITEKKLAEIELAKNYSILHELVESTSDMIFIKDLSGRYLLVNSAVTKLIGKLSFELIGKNDLEIFNEATASKFMAHDRQALESGYTQHFEEECVINQRHYFFHAAKGPFRDENGDIAGTIGISRDITDMKLAEKNLSHSYSLLIATLNATADGILVLDMNKRITHYNQPFLDLWKISERLLQNNEYEQVLHNVLDQLKNPEECLARLNQLEREPTTECYDLLSFKDGRMLERYSIPQMLDGKVVGRVFSYRDLSRRQEAKAKISS